jgi:Dyp-type peroxidase family
MNVDDIQGNVLHAYTLEHAAYLFVKVSDAAAGRRWLGELVPQVTNGSRGFPKPTSTLNVALTYAGLHALDVDRAAMDDLPDDFRASMASRAEVLGDVGPGAPEHWDAGLGTGEAHVLITLYAGSAPERDAQLAEQEQRVASDRTLRVVHRQRADALPIPRTDAPDGVREHFGYADGFSQPAVEGSGRAARSEGVRRRWWGWRELRVGEFVLGHRDEDGIVAGADAALLRNGTFMVWRKLAQDVFLFRSWLREIGGEDPAEQERVAAQVVGRWRKGESLIESPDAPATTGKANTFTYKRDRRGLVCPLGAHVRRANPRDALGWRTERTKRHRLLRRGMPYGPALAEDARQDDGQDRGLVFVCLNASISRQFELVQAHWLLDGDAFGLGGEQDLLVAPADPHGKMTVQGRPPTFLAPQYQLVTTRGGEYLFVPGMSVLRALSGRS